MEHKLKNEIKELLTELGDENAIISYTNISGLLTCLTTLNASDVIKKVKEIVNETPWRFRFILRMIPIQIVVNTELEEITNEAIKLASIIKEGENYKIEVEKRFTNIHSRDIIERIASKIDRKVKLEEPDWIILIEIVGKYTGISVLRRDEIFSLEKIKRSMD